MIVRRNSSNHRFATLLPAVGVLFLLGCTESKVNPVQGRITLGGKPYQGLLVYMRPTDMGPRPGSVGIGQTDADGNLKLMSSLGDGLDPGTYRVSFSFITSSTSSNTSLASEDKQEGTATAKTLERVPHPYSSGEESSALFTVKYGENQFDFDIPIKTDSH